MQTFCRDSTSIDESTRHIATGKTVRRDHDAGVSILRRSRSDVVKNDSYRLVRDGSSGTVHILEEVFSNCELHGRTNNVSVKDICTTCNYIALRTLLELFDTYRDKAETDPYEKDSKQISYQALAYDR